MTIIDPHKVSLAEKDIEDWLWENPRSLFVDKWIARQLQVPSGIIDLLGINQYGYPVVVEVKNVEIDAAAVLQVCRYAADIEEIVNIRTDYNAQFYVWKIVVGRGEISDKLQYEANAVNVEVHSFDVRLTLNVSGPWKWTNEKETEDVNAKIGIAKQDRFKVFEKLIPQETEPEPPIDKKDQVEIPEAFQEYLDRHSDDETPPKEG